MTHPPHQLGLGVSADHGDEKNAEQDNGIFDHPIVLFGYHEAVDCVSHQIGANEVQCRIDEDKEHGNVEVFALLSHQGQQLPENRGRFDLLVGLQPLFQIEIIIHSSWCCVVNDRFEHIRDNSPSTIRGFRLPALLPPPGG